MIALTIWQPWASLIVVGAKPYEFRGWVAPRSARGKRIAIHAGARKVKRDEIADLILRLQGETPWTTGLRASVALPLLNDWLLNTEATADHLPEPAQMIAPAGQSTPAIHRLPETKQQRFRRAQALEADLARGLMLGDDDALWLGGYRTTEEYGVLKDAFEDFGEAALR